MKKISKIIAFTMVLCLMAGLVAGCSNGTSATPSKSPSETNNNLQYPMLSEETVELSVWQTFSADYITSINDSKFVQYVEELTNVRLTFKEASPADAQTAFNLMINSGDYTDIVRPEANQYPGGPDKAIEDGVFIKLNDLVDEFAPNYSARRTVTPDVARQTITDLGNIWSMYTLNDPAEYPWNGLALRGDILEKNSLPLPVTLNDWETTLQAFVDEGMSAPLLFDMSGVNLNSEFLSAYQIGKEFYQKDGIVYFGYTQPEFRDYLTLMNQWYNKGYIDKDFISRGVNFAIFGGEPLTAILNGDAGAGLFPWGYTANAKVVDGSTLIEGFDLTPVSAPVMNEGDTLHFRFTSREAKVPNAITSACTNPEIAVKLLDYFYTDEGALLINYGKEGVSYTMVDGEPVYTDIILNNPDGFSFASVTHDYTWFDGIGMSDFKRLWQGYIGTAAEPALDAYNVWNEALNDYMIPPTTKTAEEGEEFGTLFGDIRTYANENIAKFINGTRPLSDFDAFVNQIKSMNIDRCIEIEQAALTRYIERG